MVSRTPELPGPASTAAGQGAHVRHSPGKVSTWIVDDRVASGCPGSVPARSLEGRSSPYTPPLTQQLLAVTSQHETPYQPWQCGGLLAFQPAARKVSAADCSDERACVHQHHLPGDLHLSTLCYSPNWDRPLPDRTASRHKLAGSMLVQTPPDAQSIGIAPMNSIFSASAMTSIWAGGMKWTQSGLPPGQGPETEISGMLCRMSAELDTDCSTTTRKLLQPATACCVIHMNSPVDYDSSAQL